MPQHDHDMLTAMEKPFDSPSTEVSKVLNALTKNGHYCSTSTNECCIDDDDFDTVQLNDIDRTAVMEFLIAKEERRKLVAKVKTFHITKRSRRFR